MSNGYALVYIDGNGSENLCVLDPDTACRVLKSSVSNRFQSEADACGLAVELIGGEITNLQYRLAKLEEARIKFRNGMAFGLENENETPLANHDDMDDDKRLRKLYNLCNNDVEPLDYVMQSLTFDEFRRRIDDLPLVTR